MRENQFSFMLGRSTTEAIHVLRRLMEKYRERKKDFHMVFIDLEKAYDSIPRRIIWDSLKAKGISLRYIEVIQDMYDNVSINIQTLVSWNRFLKLSGKRYRGACYSLTISCW